MKRIAISLVIYLTALMSVPCQDTNSHDSCSHLSNKESRYNHIDDCSPLCSCTCCSVSAPMVKLQSSSLINITIELHSAKIRIEDSSSSSTYAGSIWQPPKYIG